ncbi:FAD-dependent oxidoreductase [Ornithinimicrobium avium]|uniref:FAD-dependent oxidoreductase n=1 Tax=Ornithinimicrobium avium TaxID=2283195 RepID=A0A345NP66_9MICO|nr:FAD-dependent oxidoreductase [Ornithinimicrobium avium]AXH96824.1 FAD-dependent oxidoreductase [Ornithinimicrobium avium]
MNASHPPGRDRGAVHHPAAPGTARLTAPRHVVVVGGGIAGLASAAVLAERGVQVTLLEACEQLGGRVRAWPLDDGRTMSRGFHAFFRQYYTLRSLLRRADPTLTRLVPVPDYPLRRRDGLTDSFAALPATPPLNLAAFVARSPTFPVSALPSVHLPSALELIDVSYPASHERYDGESAQDFLDRLRFPEGARHLALEVFARSFFAHPADFGAGELVGMFHSYFTGSSEGLLFDVPDDDYDTALWAPLGRYLEGLGVDVRLGEPVGSLTRDGGVWHVQVAGEQGATCTADAVVLATDPRSTRALVADLPAGDAAREDWHRRVGAGRNAPPFAVLRLWLDAPVAAERDAFLGTSGYDLLDNVTVLERFEDGAAAWAAEHGGSVVELHAYAVDPARDPDLAGDSPHGLDLGRLRERLMTSLHEVYPETADRGVVHEELLVEDDCGLVGTGAWRERLTVGTPYPGLVLAGDGLRVDWPIALMERAAVTGVLAANELLRGWGVRGEDVWTVPLEGVLRRPRSAVARLGRSVRDRIPLGSGAWKRLGTGRQAARPVR